MLRQFLLIPVHDMHYVASKEKNTLGQTTIRLPALFAKSVIVEP